MRSVLNVSIAFLFMESRKYRVIVFDLGKVLIPFDFKIVVNSFNKIEPGLGDKFETFYFNNYHLHQEFDKGNITKSDFIKTMLTSIDNKVTEDEFCNLYADMFSTNKELVELLPRLKENYTLVLLSNTNIIHHEYGWGKFEFINYFDKIILSYEIGSAKPDKYIFQTVEKFTKEPPETHFFTDDILEYVDAAKALGWDAVQFTGYDDFISSLQIRSII